MWRLALSAAALAAVGSSAPMPPLPPSQRMRECCAAMTDKIFHHGYDRVLQPLVDSLRPRAAAAAWAAEEAARDALLQAAYALVSAAKETAHVAAAGGDADVAPTVTVPVPSRVVEDAASPAMQPAIVEVGLSNGGSVRMWRRVLPGWGYYGLDISPSENAVAAARASINPPTAEEEGGSAALAATVSNLFLRRISLIPCDQSSRESLAAAAAQILPVHAVWLVVDDGSHNPDHQALTFNELFPRLHPGGSYFIEDVEVSYWRRSSHEGYTSEYGYRHPSNIVERFKRVADVVMSPMLSPESTASLEAAAADAGLSIEALRRVARLEFGQNWILVTKKDATDDIFFDRPYIYAYQL